MSNFSVRKKENLPQIYFIAEFKEFLHFYGWSNFHNGFNSSNTQTESAFKCEDAHVRRLGCIWSDPNNSLDHWDGWFWEQHGSRKLALWKVTFCVKIFDKLAKSYLGLFEGQRQHLTFNAVRLHDHLDGALWWICAKSAYQMGLNFSQLQKRHSRRLTQDYDNFAIDTLCEFQLLTQSLSRVNVKHFVKYKVVCLCFSWWKNSPVVAFCTIM